MTYTIKKPSKVLAPYIKHYWMLETPVSSYPEYVQRIVPNGLFELTFYLGDKPVFVDHSKYTSFDLQFTGQLKNYFDIKISGSLSLFSVYFKPQGLSAFLDIPLKEIYNEVIPFHYLFRTGSERLKEALHQSASFTDRVDVTERFLIDQIRKRKNHYRFDRVNHCIEAINSKKGEVKIDQLASDCCLSRKQLERTFSDHIGVSPKQFIKIVRFQRAIYCRSIDQDVSLTELAYKCGYYDQSHMINDFITLSGLTPRQYFEECEPYSDYFYD